MSIAAVGIDDTFLMLAAWHGTSPKLSVEDRIETSMRHAAVSIAITSLTDATAFFIGATAPLPAVSFFTAYLQKQFSVLTSIDRISGPCGRYVGGSLLDSENCSSK